MDKEKEQDSLAIPPRLVRRQERVTKRPVSLPKSDIAFATDPIKTLLTNESVSKRQSRTIHANNADIIRQEDCDQLCGLCYKQPTTPKLLPCLHFHCAACLHTYIGVQLLQGGTVASSNGTVDYVSGYMHFNQQQESSSPTENHYENPLNDLDISVPLLPPLGVTNGSSNNNDVPPSILRHNATSRLVSTSTIYEDIGSPGPMTTQAKDSTSYLDMSGQQHKEENITYEVPVTCTSCASGNKCKLHNTIQQQTNNSQPTKSKGSLPCPTCKSLFQLGKLGVDDLPDFTLYNSFVGYNTTKVEEKAIQKVEDKAIQKVEEKAIQKVEEKAIQKVEEKDIQKAVIAVKPKAIKRQLNVCTNCESRTATFRCTDCAGLLCPGCRSAHAWLMTSRSHKVITIENQNENSNDSSNDNYKETNGNKDTSVTTKDTSVTAKDTKGATKDTRDTTRDTRGNNKDITRDTSGNNKDTSKDGSDTSGITKDNSSATKSTTDSNINNRTGQQKDILVHCRTCSGTDNVTMFCANCNSNICNKCASTLHHTHSVSERQTLISRYEHTMEKLIDQMEGRLSEHNDTITVLQEHIEGLQESKEAIAKAVREQQVQLHQLVDECCLRLLQTTDDAFNQTKNQQLDCISKVKQEINITKHCLWFTNHLLANSSDNIGTHQMTLHQLHVLLSRPDLAPSHYTELQFQAATPSVKDIAPLLGKLLSVANPVPPPYPIPPLPCTIRPMKLISKFEPKGVTEQKGCEPTGMSLLANGNIAIVDDINKKIKIFQTNGLLKFEIAPKGTNRLVDPWDVAVTVDGHFAITDRGSREIKVMTLSGQCILKFGPHLGSPWGVAVTSNGDILCTDTVKKTVFIHDSTGKLKCSIQDINPMYPSLFAYPEYITINSNGDIIVTDFERHCIFLFDKVGHFLQRVGGHGNASNQFSVPCGVAVDRDNNILVCDYNNQRILALTPDCQSMGAILTRQHGITSPQTILVTEHGRVLVADRKAIKMYSNGEIERRLADMRQNGRQNATSQIDHSESELKQTALHRVTSPANLAQASQVFQLQAVKPPFTNVTADQLLKHISPPVVSNKNVASSSLQNNTNQDLPKQTGKFINTSESTVASKSNVKISSSAGNLTESQFEGTTSQTGQQNTLKPSVSSSSVFRPAVLSPWTSNSSTSVSLTSSNLIPNITPALQVPSNQAQLTPTSTALNPPMTFDTHSVSGYRKTSVPSLSNLIPFLSPSARKAFKEMPRKTVLVLNPPKIENITSWLSQPAGGSTSQADQRMSSSSLSPTELVPYKITPSATDAAANPLSRATDSYSNKLLSKATVPKQILSKQQSSSLPARTDNIRQEVDSASESEDTDEDTSFERILSTSEPNLSTIENTQPEDKAEVTSLSSEFGDISNMNDTRLTLRSQSTDELSTAVYKRETSV